ncbi:S-layer homology domain-containing protein [Chungangia koreensis]|uniref:S-layer homology domain-containing protein n=1 Tax=Chungangia koreensis TaxID=752657 RepID=A0ABV8X2T7_9LACT
MSFNKKSYKKFTATAATAAIVASAVVPAAAAEMKFTDVNDKYTDSVNYLVDNEITQGTGEHSFGTNDSIKRGDAAVMIAKALKLDVENAPASPFTDINDRVAGAVNALHSLKVINGKSETSFAPDDKIKRSEMAKIIANAYRLNGEGLDNQFTDVADQWDEYVDALVKHEITLGKTATQFAPDANVTRGEFALFMFRAKDLIPAQGITEVTSVEATTSLVDVKADAQFLGFTVNNGKEVTVEELTKAGFTVEFQSTNLNVLKDAKTGELNQSKFVEGEEFSYKVAITKDGKTVKSSETTVKVEDFAKTVVALNDYALTVDGVELTSGTLVLNEKASISGVKGTSLKGALNFTDNTRLAFESSNKNVVVVNQNGDVTTVAEGEATITVTVKDSEVKMEIPVEVVKEARKAAKVSATSTSVSILANKSQAVAVTVVDQYGDPFQGFKVVEPVAVKAGEKTIANVTVSESDTAGEAIATVVATGETGVGNAEIKVGETTLLTLSVKVGSSNVVAKRLLEVLSTESDTTLDLNPVKSDASVKLVYNQYNADGMLIGLTETIGADQKFTVSASNDNVNVSERNGVITVTAVKTGTADIIIKEGSIVRDTVTVTVENTSPSIDSVEFASDKVESADAAMTDLLKAEGIKLTSTDAVSFGYADGKGVIFVETASVANGYTAGTDILLGTVDAVTANEDALTFDVSGKIFVGGIALTEGTKGEFTMRVLNPAGDVIKTQPVTVDVKAAAVTE